MKNKKETYDKDFIDFIDLFSKIWVSKKFIIKITILFFLLGLIYSLTLQDIYRSSSIFYPHYEKNQNSDNLRNLAGLAGLNLNNESSDNIPSSLYPKLIRSPIFKTKILLEKIIIDGNEISYRDYLIDNLSSHPIKEIIFFPYTFLSNTLSNKNNIVIKNSNILTFSNEDYKIHQYLEGILHLDINEKEGFVELSVDDKNPYVASQIAKIAKNILQESIIDFKIKNINETYKFISEQLKIAKKNFYVLQDSLAKFKDKNINIKSDLFLNQYSRIESEYNLSKNIYNDLALNKEKIAIDVRKNTPIFTVIKPVIVPNSKNSPNRSLIVIIFSIFGISLSIIWILFKNYILEIIKLTKK